LTVFVISDALERDMTKLSAAATWRFPELGLPTAYGERMRRIAQSREDYQCWWGEFRTLLERHGVMHFHLAVPDGVIGATRIDAAFDDFFLSSIKAKGALTAAPFEEPRHLSSRG
jgi:hypothetical protein